ncbi:MAG: MBL fold metallo-hydrolase [Desulfitobacterium sp.]|nr:MBL fold metallo-hydrolase [Desulfitobacterium sp.]
MQRDLKELNLNIEYVYHSGFKLETTDSVIIFDYYQGPIELPKDKKIYVFSSHAHPDHFNPQILHWQEEYPELKYIFSSDIKEAIPSSRDNYIYLEPYSETNIDSLKIKTYGSTDEGVSFFVELNEGKSIFHAGDLNWWHWWGESPEEIKLAEKMFKEEISKIKGIAIDLAFFPVDPRLEHYYSIGGEYFIQEVKPKIFVPMHFGDNYGEIKKFVEKMTSSPTQVIEIKSETKSF